MYGHGASVSVTPEPLRGGKVGASMWVRVRVRVGCVLGTQGGKPQLLGRRCSTPGLRADEEREVVHPCLAEVERGVDVRPGGAGQRR